MHIYPLKALSNSSIKKRSFKETIKFYLNIFFISILDTIEHWGKDGLIEGRKQGKDIFLLSRVQMIFRISYLDLLFSYHQPQILTTKMSVSCGDAMETSF